MMNVAEPIIVDPCNRYKLPDVLTSIKTGVPSETFRTPPTIVYLHLRGLRVPRKIRFLFKLRTCQTLVNVLIMPSCILIQMALFSTTL